MRKEYTITSVVNKMIWISLVVGLVVGGGGGALTVHLINKKKPRKDEVAIGQIQVQKQLTDIDLIKPICDPQYIKEDENGSLLCRALFCRMQQRGLDSKTSQLDCSNISNQLNKSHLFRFCTKSTKTKEDFRSCIELFDRRL